jgi:hypothetical protein
MAGPERRQQRDGQWAVTHLEDTWACKVMKGQSKPGVATEAAHWRESGGPGAAL